MRDASCHPPKARVQLARVDAIATGALDWLTRDERRRFDEMASIERRDAFVAGHRLARDLGARWHAVAPARISVHRHDDGRPCLHLDDAPSPFSISLSHSGDWILAGIATVPIGVDVEVPRRPRNIDRLARHAFAPEDVDRLLALPTAERLGAFHELWALQEARGKRTGEGFLPGHSRRIRVFTAEREVAEAFSWRLGEGGAVAIALQGAPAPELDDDGCLAHPRGWRFQPIREA